MQASKALREEFVDPVCGKTVDPARAAGTSVRDGVRYFFCSSVCKQKLDAAGETVVQESCCGADVADAPVQLTVAPVQLTAKRRSSAVAAHPTQPRHAQAEHG